MSEDLVPIKFRVNGRQNEITVRPQELLIDFVRERLALTGTKRSCDMEVCGTCTVLLDGKAVSSCSLFAFELDGKDLTTIEGLEGPEGLHPLQKAFIQCGGFQCGFLYSRNDLAGKELARREPGSDSGTSLRLYGREHLPLYRLSDDRRVDLACGRRNEGRGQLTRALRSGEKYVGGRWQKP